jgi:SAM-dependent methyltransferase
MRSNDLVLLDVKPQSLANLFDYVLKQSAGKKVLCVGAAGHVKNYLPDKRDRWLYYRLGQVCAELVGVDIDTSAIDYAAAHGVEILHANCEVMDLNRKFDIIVLSDVIEHLNAPVNGICNLVRHLAPLGRILVTTPNMTGLNVLARVLRGRGPNVYWDHVTCYLPEHIQAMCDRHGFRLKEVLFFNLVDRQSMCNQLKSYLAIAASRVNPRWATSFLAVVEKCVDK